MEARILAQTLLARTTAVREEMTPSQGVTDTGLSWQTRIEPYGATVGQGLADAAVITVTVTAGRETTYALSTVALVPKKHRHE